MERFYFLCAIIGGTLFLCQFLLSLFGFGADHGVDGHIDAHTGGDVGHDTSLFTGIVSFRALVAGLTVFGLTGMIALAYQLHPLASLPISIAAAFLVMLVVAFVMRSISQLHSEGTINIQNAVGCSGTVYLAVPGQRNGMGKVTVTLQNRTIEFQASTSDKSLETGTKVKVVKVIGSDTVEVVAAN